MFASAEARRVAEVTPLVLATYTGPGDRAAVVAFIEAKVRPWYEKKKLAIETLEAEYVAILALDRRLAEPGVLALARGERQDVPRGGRDPSAFRGVRGCRRRPGPPSLRACGMTQTDARRGPRA